MGFRTRIRVTEQIDLERRSSGWVLQVSGNRSAAITFADAVQLAKIIANTGEALKSGDEVCDHPQKVMAPAVANQHKTLTQMVRERILAAIELGVFIPGTRLREASLSELYGVSRTPVREALSQLASLGVVRYLPHCGCEVVGGAS